MAWLRSLQLHSKSKRSVLAPKMGPFRCVEYSPIFRAKVAHLDWSRFGPNKRGRNSPLLSGQYEEAKGLFWFLIGLKWFILRVNSALTETFHTFS